MNTSDKPTMLTTTEFTDRVMTAISRAPMPTPTRTFVAAMRARALRDAVAALWVAWHLGTVRAWHVAPRVRARSFALVLAVTSVLATGSLAAAAAVHSVVPQRDDRNPVMAPSGSGVDELGPTRNGQTGTEGPDQIDNASRGPTASKEPDATDHDAGGSTIDRPDDADDGVDQPDESDDSDDGSNGDDRPAATDDHDDPDDGVAPEETDEPDEASDGGALPEAPDDGGSGGGGD